MIVSRHKNFIFIANVKSASSSIERCLAKYADIHIKTTRCGKHMSIREAHRLILGYWPQRYLGKPADLFSFGVLRTPLSWALSLYNSHTRPVFANTPADTSNKKFDEFLENSFLRRSNKPWQLRPQYLRFVNAQGRPKMDFLIRYEKLNSDFRVVRNHLGLRVYLPHVNRSPKKIQAHQVSEKARQLIETAYSGDYEFYEKYTGRLLR